MLHYKNLNVNPKGRKTGDCSTRALVGCLGLKYDDVLDLQLKFVKKYYYDFNKPCKYRSCLHIKEDGCSIIEEVNKGKIPEWRYQNYLKIMEETKE